MGLLTSPELNTVLLSSLLGIIVAAGGTIIAWLKVQTKKYNEMAERNTELLNQNVAAVEDIRRQTDGMNVKLQKIAAAAAFTKGRVQGREEGEGVDPYEDLYKLEEEIGGILELDLDKKKPKQ